MSDRKYWRKRSVKLGLLSERKAQRTARAVLDAYDRVLTTVQGRIERIFTRFVRNNDSLNAEKARQILSMRETQKYRQELLVLYHSTTDKALRDELRAMLEAPAYANRISRLEALRDIVRADCRQLGLLERELVGKGLADALQEAYTRQVFDIQQGTGYGRRIKTLEDKQVRAILGQKWRGGNFSGRIWNNNQAFADAVQQTILTGTLAGMSFREMSDMLLQITGTDATSGAKARSMRLIRTEFCHISAQGALLGYKSYDLEYYRYLATLDSQTDEECGALDMRRFPVKDARPGVNFPPMHPNCRCTTMPDMSEQVIAKIKRAARDPVTGKSITVPGNMSYAEWHKKFVQGVPDDVVAKVIQIPQAETTKRVSESGKEQTPSEKTGDMREVALIRADIRNGAYPLTINAEKQSRHMPGGNYIPGRSVITVTIEELQTLVNQFAGTGEILLTPKGEWKKQEIVDFGCEIGYTVNKEGKNVGTSKAKLHYSKTGVHVVPYSGKG